MIIHVPDSQANAILGSMLDIAVFDPAWEFWAHIGTPLEELRHTNGVPPVDPALVA